MVGPGRRGRVATALESVAARSVQPARRACRHAGGRLVGHALVEERARRGVQRGVLASVRLEGPAAALGHPVHERLLTSLRSKQEGALRSTERALCFVAIPAAVRLAGGKARAEARRTICTSSRKRE